MTYFTPLIGLLWRTLDSYGIDPSEVIPEEMYRPARRSVAAERTPLDEFNRVLAKAASLIKDPAAGLEAARQLHPSHLGALGHAWMASSSLRDAIQRTSRYHQMLNEKLIMEVGEGEGVLKATYRSQASGPVLELQADSLLGSLFRLCQFNFGPDLTPAFVNLMRASPPEPGPWSRFFGVDVAFGQPDISLGLYSRDVDRELTVASPQLVAVHEEIIQRHMGHMSRSDITNRVRTLIMEQLPSGSVTEKAIAARMGMSRKTLYNQLQARDASFRQLLTEVRKDLARKFIYDHSYSVTEISFLLGYSDSSAFSRAFRSWFGVPPTKYRES